MDVLSQVALMVDNVQGSSNPALFCTRLGGPITFHLKVGKDEEKLVKSVRKTVNNYGGRYVKRYDEMTPHTVLLVTDHGFRSGAYNRPAICVTYVGDCVHTNTLRNINDYLHPWDNQDRWKKIDLFEVVYHQNRMFQCTSLYHVNKPYVPVSRKIRYQAPRHGTLVQNNDQSLELVEVSSEDGDLFVHTDKVTLATSEIASDVEVISEDGDLFVRVDEEAVATSEASTNVRSSPCEVVQMGFSIRTRVQRPTAHPAVERGNFETTNQKSAAPCKDLIIPDNCRSTNIVNQPNVLHPPQNVSQRETSSPSQCISRLEKICISQSNGNAVCKEVVFPPRPPLHLKSHQKRQKELRESKNCKDKNCETIRNCYVMLNRIPEDVIQDESSISLWALGGKNLEEPISNFETGPSVESEEWNGLPKSQRLVTKESLEEYDQDSAGHHRDHRSTCRLNQQKVPLGLTKAKSKNVGSQKPSGKRCSKAHQKRSEKIRDNVGNNNPYALPERPSVDGTTSTQPDVSSQDNSKKGTGNLDPSASQNRTVENVGGESSVQKLVSAVGVPSCSYQGLHKIPKLSCKSTMAVADKSSARECSQREITNSRKDRNKCVRENELQRRNRIRDQESALSDGEGSSISSVRCVPQKVPMLDISSESSVPYHQNPGGDRRPKRTEIELVTPKSENKDDLELFKKRGRGYQDRYRRCEKVAMLKWLVEHQKFRNLRGVLVWREMERKRVIPGRSNQSLKNHFLKHLMRKLDDYPFLTEDQKRKFRGMDSQSSDEDDDFFYHGSVHHFPKTE